MSKLRTVWLINKKIIIAIEGAKFDILNGLRKQNKRYRYLIQIYTTASKAPKYKG